jgi:16S rRNA processing protein RimM
MNTSSKTNSKPSQSNWLEGFCIIGEVLKPHGVHGEIKIRPETFDNRRLSKFKSITLANPSKQTMQEYELIKKRLAGTNTWIIQIEGYTTPEAVNELRNHLIVIPDSERLKLPKGQFYFSDLDGLNAIDSETKQKIGKVTQVHDYPSVAVFEIKIKGKKINAPWIEDCIGDVNLEKNEVEVHLDFLRDTYDWL